jgi:HEPN domain-containing protein
MKQTAVEWLHELSKQRELDKFDWEQVKEMEKEQIIDAYIKGYSNMAPEQYYNETFKQD